MAALKLLSTLAVAASLFAADKADNKSIADKHPTGVNFNIPLWDEGQVPLSKGDGPLDKPFLTVFLPPDSKRNGGSVVVAPGGSNIMLMYGAEGIDIAERYNDWGVTAFVLTYRLAPRYGNDARVADAQRALRLVRSRAAEFKLDPKRVGYIGFSAGSNLGTSMVAAVKPSDPNATDSVDRLSSRPDYLGLVYGPGRATAEQLKSFPPTFLMCAAGDTQNAIGSANMFAEMLKAGVVAEIHVYQKGHHGFGDGFASGTFSDWMGRLEHFLKQGGFIPGGKE